MFVSVIVVASAIILALCLIIIVRNHHVLKYRLDLIDKVSAASKASAGPYVWRWDEMERVSYDEMVFKFWKPLDSFYPDKSFIEY